jgi:hypothetical protein
VPSCLTLLTKLLLLISYITQASAADVWMGAGFAASPASLRAASESIKAGKHDSATVLLDDLHFSFDARGALAV